MTELAARAKQERQKEAESETESENNLAEKKNADAEDAKEE